MHPAKPTGTLRRLFSRRGFLWVGCLGIGANVAALLLPAPRVRQRRILEATLRKYLDGVGFDDHDFERFAREYARANPVDWLEEKLAPAWPVYRHTRMLERTYLAPNLERYAERIVTRFLLATDIFEPAREGAPRYLGLSTPLKNGCLNPLAKLRPVDE